MLAAITQIRGGDTSPFVGISAQFPAVQGLLLLAPIPLLAELCSSVILKSAKLSSINSFSRFFQEGMFLRSALHRLLRQDFSLLLAQSSRGRKAGLDKSNQTVLGESKHHKTWDLLTQGLGHHTAFLVPG